MDRDDFQYFRCVRCGHVWQSALTRPSCCSKCKTNNFDKPRKSIEINTAAEVGESLIFAKFAEWNGMNDQQANRIKQDTIARKLKKMGIPFRVVVQVNGVHFIRQ